MCAPAPVVDYFEKVGESSFYDYYNYLWDDKDKGGREMLIGMMEGYEPKDFNEFMELMQQNMKGVD